ncbi:MAG: flagellar biosynthesis protein FlgA [Alphaproteobacteria bacterium]|nr:flagellar biosynthesis protein FlgA [Alphaproteobacteria bacterium]
MLLKRATENRPMRVGVIGCGKFAAMYLAQAPTTAGLHVMGIADLSPARARAQLERVGWDKARFGAASLGAAIDQGTTFIGDDVGALLAHPAVDVIVESTGHPPAAVRHALMAFKAKKHVVMVTVEADAMVGPLLARRAAEAGVIYSLAYGDQPALICDLVDWARASGFEVTAAGRGHKWLASYAQSTPETVWDHYGLTAEQARIGGMNPQMFNSFLDGTKPAIECTAVANGTGLTPAPGGLDFPPCGIDDLPHVMRPRAEGGMLDHVGQVEVVSSLERDGRPVPRDIRWGVWVVMKAPNDYVKRCFKEYGMVTDASGSYGVMYKRWHLIGLELGISVASVALRGESTGCPTGFRADAVATAKRNLKAGETLDGEGGYTVYGRLMPAATSLAASALPIGLAHGVKLTRAVKQGATVTWADVAVDASDDVAAFRRDMERIFAAEAPRARAAE